MLQFGKLRSFFVVLFVSISVLVSCPFLCFGQNDDVKALLYNIKDKWKIEDENVVVQKIIEIDNISKDNIYIALKEHLVSL